MNKQPRLNRPRSFTAWVLAIGRGLVMAAHTRAVYLPVLATTPGWPDVASASTAVNADAGESSVSGIVATG